MNTKPKYSFYGLLETPTDVENAAKQRILCESSSAGPSSRMSKPDERITNRSYTPMRYGAHVIPPHTPLSTSSGPMRTPRGANTTNTPFTTSSAISSDNESSTIAALVEGRGYARGEIGITSFDLKHPVLILSQFSDCQTYAKTLAKLQNLSPLEILLPSTMCEASPGNKLFNAISEQFHNVTVSSVQRRYYNENKGLQFVKHLCADEYKAIELQISSKYYCLATTAALIKYVEFVQNIVIAPKSLKVIFRGSERATMIDSTTAKFLELVRNLKDPSSQQTLFGVLNYTKTPGGARLLRSNILQPLNDEETIHLRQQAVTELTGKEDIFYNLQSVISKFPDIGHVVSVCIQIPKHESVRTAETKIACVIMLKRILQLVSTLKENLSNCENTLLKLYCQALENPNYELILEKINEIISRETHYTKGLLQQKMQKCMAVKEHQLKRSRLLVDSPLSREKDEMMVALCHKFVGCCSSYSYRAGSRFAVVLLVPMPDYVEQIGRQHQLPLRPGYSSLRGHHIQMPNSALPGVAGGSGGGDDSAGDGRNGLPSVFMKVSKFKSTLSFTTMDLIQLNERAKRAMDEIFLMTNIVATQLLVNIRDYIGCLYELSDIVSMVDMLLAFSNAASLYSYVIPEFTDTLAVKQGLHPILQKTGSDNFVPNDIYASEHSNFVIITGPNMGGKSTYLRQVALLQIMAQIGSFVPALYASFRIADQIFSRIGSDDDMESNSSTFTLEMKESNYILQNITDSSLVIIDELGRGTSAEEGMGICWAIAEKIICTKAMTFFVTHFMQLTDLHRNHPNVANYFFEMQRVFNKEANCENCTFTHVLTRGVTPETHYGLQLAEMSSLPRSVVEDAKRIAASVEKAKQKHTAKDDSLVKQHACFNLATKLIQVAKNSRMDDDTLRAYLKNLHRSYTGEIEKATRVVSRFSTSSDTSFSN